MTIRTLIRCQQKKLSTLKLDHNDLFNETDKPYGYSYGEWTVKWWQWVFSIPSRNNPLNDSTGINWDTQQPTSNVWFLVGSVGGIDKKFSHRKIKIRSGRSILFPVLNCEANSLEYPELKTHDDLLRHVVDDVNSVVKKEVSIDGSKVLPVRVSADPKIFNLIIGEENVFRVQKTGGTQATADGYWIFLKSLPVGSHSITFEGACEFGRLSAGASYELEIF